MFVIVLMLEQSGNSLDNVIHVKKIWTDRSKVTSESLQATGRLETLGEETPIS